jgi:hypothetical protein
LFWLEAHPEPSDTIVAMSTSVKISCFARWCVY